MCWTTNIAHVAQTCRSNGVNWRPHFKGHKTLEIAKKQLAAGAIGITCAKLGEAEILAAAGIRDILIANQIVGAAKIERLMAVLGAADPIVSVDSRGECRRLGRGCGASRQDPARRDGGQHRHEPGGSRAG